MAKRNFRGGGGEDMVWESLQHLVSHVANSENHELNVCADRWDVVVDRDGHFAYLSPYYYEKKGFSEDELIGKPFLDLVAADIGSKEQMLFQEAFDTREPVVKLSFRRTRPDGSAVIISTSGTPQFDSQGTFIGSSGARRGPRLKRRCV